MAKFKKDDPRTKELQRKGGLNSKGKTSIAKSLINRKHCKPDCSIYFDCPFMPAGKKSGKCTLKEMPQQIQNWTVGILKKGSEGMIDAMKSMVLDLMIEAKTGKFRDRKDALYALKDILEAAYGKKIKQEITGEMRSEITVNDFKRAMKEVKE